jgi:AraC-like DNA-binding protein
MTITMSEQAWADLTEEIFQQAQYPDPEDHCDLLLPQPDWLAQGYWREISLRDGLMVQIANFQRRDRVSVSVSERREAIRFHCHLSGDHQDGLTEVGNLEYMLSGHGVAPKHTMICSGQFPILEVEVEMQPDVLIAFVGKQGELPQVFQHLIDSATQSLYARVGSLSPTMQGVLWQILRCPYQGMMKRMYLESKAIELATLILEQERDIQQGRGALISLKPEEVDRIHHAREILLRNLEQPPSLNELARQVGLNGKALKQGFRACFGQPVFGYLLDYRMEQAQQLLMSGELKVGEVMQQVGFRSRKYFAAAFRKKYGVNPKDYLKVKIAENSSDVLQK